MKLEQLDKRLSEIISDYTDNIKMDIESRLDKTAQDILEYIKKNCPRSSSGKNHLADSFVITIFGSGATKTIYISSATKGSLVHLIELGFKHTSGKFVEARPFLRPAYEAFTPDMLTDIKTIIKRQGG